MGNEVMTETAVNQNEIKLQRKDLLVPLGLLRPDLL